MENLLLVRQGKMREVYPDVFPTGPYERGIVANMVDVAARDLAEVMAPLPAINCASTSMVTDKARQKAEKRTLIASGYTSYSRLQRQAYVAADRFVSFGFAVALVEPDFDAKLPRIQFMDSMGAYPIMDRWGRLECVFWRFMRSRDELVAMYPSASGYLHDQGMSGSELIEVVRYHDKDQDLLMLPYGEGFVLNVVPNKVGRVCASWIERPSIDTTQHGQFDDVLAVQVAKSRFALLSLEAATKAVQAPIAVPMDILELSIGPDSIIKSQHPEQIRRIGLDIPASAFSQQQILEKELRDGSRYPQARQGEVGGSIVTGRGVQELMSGFDTQIRTAQAMFAIGFTELFEIAFQMDEILWPEEQKTLRGNSEGVPFEITYTPSKDIAGDHTVDVQYGLMAGLDPNRALVFGLQARGDKLISRDFMRRNLPFNMNATQEEAKVDVEEARDALKQAVYAYAQAIPALAEQGQDVSAVLLKLSAVIKGRQSGKSIEDVIQEAFKPTPPPVPPGGDGANQGSEQPPGDGSPDMMAAPPGAMPPGAPGAGPAGGDGLAPSGLMQGVAPGQAGMGPGGKPDLQTLLAGLGAGGGPKMQANITRRMPI